MNPQIKQSRERQSCKRIQKLRNILLDCHEKDLDYSQTAKKLNDHGFRQFDGCSWNKAAVRKYVELIFGLGW
jgi:hypothetical protein